MDRRRFLLTLPLAAGALGGCEAFEAENLKYERPEPIRSPDVAFVPTRQEVVEAMLQLAGTRKDDVVYDLGCGDGRIVITAAQKFGARGVGIDIDRQRVSEANYNARRAKVHERTKFILGDIFEADVSEATVVTLYLLPEVNLRLRPKLRAELKPGARIVAHDFGMGDWTPERTVKVGNSTIFLWTIPAR
jgi:SAM-dependent methyltransferase